MVIAGDVDDHLAQRYGSAQENLQVIQELERREKRRMDRERKKRERRESKKKERIVE